MLIRVQDAGDPRLSDYVALRDTTLRRSLESERGLFIAEGEKVYHLIRGLQCKDDE